jgi:hypothetical protein
LYENLEGEAMSVKFQVLGAGGSYQLDSMLPNGMAYCLPTAVDGKVLFNTAHLVASSEIISTGEFSEILPDDVVGLWLPGCDKWISFGPSEQASAIEWTDDDGAHFGTENKNITMSLIGQVTAGELNESDFRERFFNLSGVKIFDSSSTNWTDDPAAEE